MQCAKSLEGVSVLFRLVGTTAGDSIISSTLSTVCRCVSLEASKNISVCGHMTITKQTKSTYLNTCTVYFYCFVE